MEQDLPTGDDGDLLLQVNDKKDFEDEVFEGKEEDKSMTDGDDTKDEEMLEDVSK